MSEHYQICEDLDTVDAEQWNRIAGSNPLIRYEFFKALHQTGCATSGTGWSPHFLLMYRQTELVAAMPLYLKWHSRGEYVFDYAWARAFEQHGLAYYPKLLSAVPFSPVQGPRLLAAKQSDRISLAKRAIQIANDNKLSSLHILFPNKEDRLALEEVGFLFRDTVQFHWHNQGYQSLDDFLGTMSQKNRKKIRQDKNRAKRAGVEFEWLEGADIDSETLAFFYRCYCQTYFEHGHTPYLNLQFFAQLQHTMPDNLVLIVAWQNGQRIACALNFKDDKSMYGRYWGAKTFISGLHFETCYIQSIEYCIKNKLEVFEGGAQGEHKLARGLLPVVTPSAHWVRDSRYANAIHDFVNRESEMIDNYVETLDDHSPFKRGESPDNTRLN